MPFDISGAVVGVQLPSYGDGTTQQLTEDRTGALRISQNGGSWGDMARLGYMFTYSTPAAGVVLPLYTSTVQQCVFWNPLGSGRAFQLRKITLGYVSGTAIASSMVLTTQTLVTNAISGTQSALVQNNKMTGNYNAAGQNGGMMQLFTVATVVQFTYFRTMQLSQVVQSATDINPPWIYSEDFDGSLWLLPGAAIAVAGSIAAGTRAAVSFEGAEIPTPLAA